MYLLRRVCRATKWDEEITPMLALSTNAHSFGSGGNILFSGFVLALRMFRPILPAWNRLDHITKLYNRSVNVLNIKVFRTLQCPNYTSYKQILLCSFGQGCYDNLLASILN